MPQALRAHFEGTRPIGIHSTSLSNECRWLAFDLDDHDDIDCERTNRSAAATICERLEAHGLAGRTFNSDGGSGRHVWCVLPRRLPSAAAFDLARQVGDGLGCECFPKQSKIRPGGYGNWLRLFGQHPRTGCWSHVWLGDRWGSTRQTIEAIIRMGRAGLASALAAI